MGKAEWTNKEGRALRFQPSHAEHLSTSEHWTTDEWGNTLADVAAGAESNTDLATPAAHNVVLEESSLQWVMRQLMEDGQWHWSHVAGQVDPLR